MTKTWGPPTWYLFHTLAEKMNEDDFAKIKMELINIIKMVCKNLPCPDCSGHATSILNKLNLNLINSKNDLKKMLLWFHNQVNRRLRNPIFTQDDLDKKYKLANTKNIVEYFIQVWSKRTHNPKLMTQDMHKTRAVTQFTEWWKKNYIYFKP